MCRLEQDAGKTIPPVLQRRHVRVERKARVMLATIWSKEDGVDSFGDPPDHVVLVRLGVAVVPLQERSLVHRTDCFRFLIPAHEHHAHHVMHTTSCTTSHTPHHAHELT